MITRLERDLLHEMKHNQTGLIRTVSTDELPSTWSGNNELLRVDLNWFTPEGVAYIKANTKTTAVVKKVEAFERIQSNPETKIGTLKNIPTIVKARYGEAKYKWLFEQMPDGTLLPWFVKSAEYNPPKPRYDQPATAEIDLVAYGLRSLATKTLRWTGEKIVGKSFGDLLADCGMLEWDEDLMEQYLATTQRWREVCRRTGDQMVARGDGKMYYWVKRYYDDRKSLEDRPVSLTVDGKPVKFVIDCETEELSKEKDRTISKAYWSKASTEDDEIEDPIPVPQHPEVLGFSLHLRHHNYVLTYVTNIEEYPWNDKIEDCLVLPKEDKRLIRLLVEATGKKMSDIVSGKSGGVIVLSSGFPGTGKTLTAEVTSELLKKALYNVQCAQLGIGVGAIEENLETILTRATRWGALLLIDEADVYVRSRGKDIEQNAIVGVFLRLLEYYNGFLFMTTNRAVTVDDAILSRCTAHVRYDLPGVVSLKKIGKIQAELLEIAGAEDAVAHLVATYKNLSGRDMRSVMKMAKLICEAEEKEISNEVIDFCVKYQDISATGV
jgi:hypothetical protein